MFNIYDNLSTLLFTSVGISAKTHLSLIYKVV